MRFSEFWPIHVTTTLVNTRNVTITSFQEEKFTFLLQMLL